jgi:hypothetical protein
LQVLLSGSLAVQSALGVPAGNAEWNRADVDIFCTWEAAPVVRRRLIERCKLICSGVDNDYGQAQRDLVGDVEDGSFSAVHHVETYAARPTEDVYSSEEYYEQAAQWGAEAVGTGGNLPHCLVKLQGLLAYMPANTQASANSRELLARAAADPSFCEMLGTVGMPGGSAGGVFPYDFALRTWDKKTVQLIVGRPGKKDACQLLESFDLEICKCSFDGRSFRAPAPADTFARRIACTSARRELVRNFLTSEAIVNPGTSVAAMQTVLARMPAASWAGIGLGPFMEGDVFRGDEHFQQRYPIMTSLIERMQKYARRGVAIVDAPVGEGVSGGSGSRVCALDWVVKWYHPMDGQLT